MMALNASPGSGHVRLIATIFGLILLCGLGSVYFAWLDALAAAQRAEEAAHVSRNYRHIAEGTGLLSYWENPLTADEVLKLAAEAEASEAELVSITRAGELGKGPGALRFARPGKGQGVFAIATAIHEVIDPVPQGD